MGNTQSSYDAVVVHASKVPTNAVPCRNESIPERVICLRDKEHLYPFCAKLFQIGIPIHAIRHSDPVCIWVRQCGALQQNITQNVNNPECCGFPIIPTFVTSKGSHEITYGEEGFTQFDLNRERRLFEDRGFQVSAQSSPTEFGTKKLYFSA